MFVCSHTHTHTHTHSHAGRNDENFFLRKRLSQFNHCYYSNHDDMFLNGLLYVFINNTLPGKKFWRAGMWWRRHTHTHTHTHSRENLNTHTKATQIHKDRNMCNNRTEWVLSYKKTHTHTHTHTHAGDMFSLLITNYTKLKFLLITRCLIKFLHDRDTGGRHTHRHTHKYACMLLSCF